VTFYSDVHVNKTIIVEVDDVERVLEQDEIRPGVGSVVWCQCLCVLASLGNGKQLCVDRDHDHVDIQTWTSPFHFILLSNSNIIHKYWMH
jgi:hypothetical protein